MILQVIITNVLDDESVILGDDNHLRVNVTWVQFDLKVSSTVSSQTQGSENAR